MEQHFRKIMIVGRALEGKARGPLIYSGSEFSLLPTRQDEQKANWRVIFWFWIPPEQRRARRFKSEVPNAQAFELAALADGTLEEVGFNISWPLDMTTDEATRRLKEEYGRRIVGRLGLAGESTRAREVDLVIARA